jgi:hypothetical protein
MLMQMAITDQSRKAPYRVPHPSELTVWRTANQMLKQYSETSCLVAAQRADSAYAAGQMFNFHHWARVTHALTELLRQRTSADTVN